MPLSNGKHVHPIDKSLNAVTESTPPASHETGKFSPKEGTGLETSGVPHCLQRGRIPSHGPGCRTAGGGGADRARRPEPIAP